MGVIVVRPVVADVAEVGFDRPVAAVEHEHLRLGADKLGMRCTGVARAAERDRHLPALPGGVGIVERIAILPQRHLKLVPRTSCRHANKRDPRHLAESQRDRRDRFVRCGLESRPQIRTRRVRIGMLAHVPPQAVAKLRFAQIGFQHADEAQPFQISDVVERGERLRFVRNRLLHRMRRTQRVLGHGLFLLCAVAHPDLHRRVELVGELLLHP